MFEFSGRLQKWLFAASLLVFSSAVMAGGGGGEGGGILSVSGGLGFWTIVTFVCLLLVLRATAWKPIIEGLETRENTIRTAIENAKQAEEKTAALLAEYEKKLASADEEVHKIIEEGRKKAQEQTDKMIAEATKDCERIRERSERELQSAKNDAIKQVFRVAAELSVALSSKLVQKSLNADDHNRIIEETISQFKGNQLDKYVN